MVLEIIIKPKINILSIFLTNIDIYKKIPTNNKLCNIIQSLN
jgi:hypothetical protein